MYFKFIRAYIESVLGAYVTRFPVSRVEFLGNVNEHAKALREAYKNARTGETKVEYSDLFCRLAFLYMYGAIHATLFENVLRCSHAVGSKFQGGPNPVRIVSIGGGPTVELLGMAKHVADSEFPGIDKNCTRIELTNIDAISQWKGIGSQIANRLKIQQPNPIIRYNLYEHKMQSELPASRPVKEALSEADIILLSYYFSDVTAEKDESKNAKFIEWLMAMTPGSCLFVVIDANYVKHMVRLCLVGYWKRNL